MSTVTLSEIVFDETIYPRASWSQAVVDRYADALNAGEHFPAITLEAGTRRLLDGKHRVEAHRKIGRHFLAADLVEVPEDVPPVLYAASLSSRHGDALADKDKRTVARKIVDAAPDYSMVLIAKQLGVTRQTVSRYVGDLVEHRRDLRKAKALLLKQSGMSMQQVADTLGVDKATAVRDVNDEHSAPAEELLREAATGLPIDAEPLIAAILAAHAEPDHEPEQPPTETPEPTAEVAPTPAVGSGPTSPEPEPAALCEKCSRPLDRTEAEVGYLRCGDCDSDGDHVARELADGTIGPCRACHPDPEPEPETCLGTDMDCGRSLPCPNHPRTPAERIAAVAAVAPEFVRPAESYPDVLPETIATPARRSAIRLVAEVTELVGDILAEPELVTPEMVAALREQADRLEQVLGGAA